ncbi:4'-phosphopantetheinyl transferase superfamily protein [Streptomyces sp. TRM70350]|uniref:4'-phosphopantetheinyl transferase superfamily protein n=1 Tax=Streptomyces sp. TRM70350 TaxID=2856165 RepID=UPI0035A8AE2F
MERAALRRLPYEERNARLVRLWSLKEAYTKALGQGCASPSASSAWSFLTTSVSSADGPDGDHAVSAAGRHGARAGTGRGRRGTRRPGSGDALRGAARRPGALQARSASRVTTRITAALEKSVYGTSDDPRSPWMVCR